VTCPPPTPPSTTHSPYTTLFRSAHQSAHPRRARPILETAGLQEVRSSPAAFFWHHSTTMTFPETRPPSARGRVWHVVAAAAVSVDRKSTRLNSSHVKISYAVFCL